MAEPDAMRRMFGLAGLAAAWTILGCSHSSLPAASVPLPPELRWQDVFAVTPELVIMVRPQALRRDPLYGALLERSIELARMRSRVVAETRAFDAISDAEEVVVGASSSTAGASEDLVLVVRGVRSDIDPVRLVDSEGRALWSPGPSGAVRELVRQFDPDDPIDGDARGAPKNARSTNEASLFELPGRTWVIAVGAARQRARDAFAQRGRRGTSIPMDPLALATVRIAGPSLAAHLPALQEDGGLAAVGRRLRALTFVLPADGLPRGATPPANGRSVQLDLSYEEEHSAELAEGSLRRVIAAIANVAAAKSGRMPLPTETVAESPGPKTTVWLEWLGLAAVDRTVGDADDRAEADKTRITVTGTLPHTFIDALLRMSSGRWAPRPPSAAPAGPAALPYVGAR